MSVSKLPEITVVGFSALWRAGFGILIVLVAIVLVYTVSVLSGEPVLEF